MLKNIFFGILAFWQISAHGAERFTISSSLHALSTTTGFTIQFPAKRGFTYEVVRVNGDTAEIRVFDPEGAEVLGGFQVKSNLIKEAFKDEVKADIQAGLKAATDGASAKKGCCDVVEADPAPKGEKKPGRDLALAPDEDTIPIPRPKPEREQKPVPKPTPKPEQKPEKAPAPEEPTDGKGKGNLCSAYRSFRKQGVPEKPLKQAMAFLEKARKNGTLKSTRYFSVADYSRSSREKRFYFLDLESKKATFEKVSHGGGGKGKPGDPDHDGMLNRCGMSGSKQTRAGFFRVGDYYLSSKNRYKWPLLTRKPPRNGMQLHGLTPGVNDDAISDGYVMHEAKYNASGNAVMGRSHGCPAFVPGKGAPVMAKLRGGSLLYNYAPQCGSQMNVVKKQIKNWEKFCE
jgi:hypothetical protein